jgi:hypothetical protein
LILKCFHKIKNKLHIANKISFDLTLKKELDQGNTNKKQLQELQMENARHKAFTKVLKKLFPCNMMKIKKCFQLEYNNTSEPKIIRVSLEILLRLQRKNLSIMLKR